MGVIKPSNQLEKILSKFNEKQLREIFTHLSCFQLTEGCNTACPDCGLDAPPKVRDYIPASFALGLFERFPQELSTCGVILYSASEPFDYQDGEWDYFKIHDAFEKIVGVNPEVHTSIAVGKEVEILRAAISGNTLGNFTNDDNTRLINIISITPKSYKRIEKALNSMIEFKDQLVFDSIYSEGVFNYKGRFQSILHDNVSFLRLENLDEIMDSMGIIDSKAKFDAKEIFYLNGENAGDVYIEHKFEDNEPIFAIKPEEVNGTKGNIYIVKLPNGDYLASESKPVGLRCLLKYFKVSGKCPSKVSRASIRSSYHWRRRNFGIHLHDSTKDYGRRKLGRKNIDDLDTWGIGCGNGTKINPSGVFNVEVTIPSKEYPTGEIITPIAPTDFKVTPYNYIGNILI